MAKSSVSMKLLINTTKGGVVFAEAGKDCIDFLFHMLSLPIATVIRLLKDQGMQGSFPNLYQSLDTLNDAYILRNASKDTFLKPAAPLSSPLLALNYAPTQKIFYGCNNNNSNNHSDHYDSDYDDDVDRHKCCQFVSDDPLAVCLSCSRKMTRQLKYVNPPPPAADEKGLVKGVVTYIVMDDLAVKPMSTISTITLLTKVNVNDLGPLEEKVVNLGMKEAVKLLKASLDSKTVLTDVFC